ncbi:hypothetical protein [Aeromonas sp. sif2433]|uniref:hypothetical protein n=1 Tax=Aeromonas sp. sif2433 TaxID=2854794 RepID=UPI001C44CAB4|nr:hypothetical protein [Aeromonas sp. sif2433]MBV7416462.1 hypothetical protein [Aeromonas sp. sif2433]
MNEGHDEKNTLFLTKNGDLKFILERPLYAAEKHLNVVEDNGKPLKISVETATDWPIFIATLIVGIGSILTTAFVARISHVNQRSQIRSNIAAFRQKWQEELRSASTEFFSCAIRVHYDRTHDNKALTPEKISELTRCQVRMELMLDKKKNDNKKIEQSIERVITLAQGLDTATFTTEINNLQTLVSQILEKAWIDIKNDLHGISPH